ncbi:MAG: hypothetical protein H0W03_08740 [Solirubrobacterales bacterium]|jgi:hypothetical protein|nr:hypothetical protein [Solirubrobacterales bacterium]
MDRDTKQQETEPRPDITGPDVPTGEATHPPGNGVTDEDAKRTAEEKLHQAGGGH